MYKTHFDKDATRYVSWEVSLLHPAYGVDRTFLYESVVQDAAGRSIAQQSFSSTIEDDWAGSYHHAIWGQPDAGTWDLSWYSVTVSIDGGEVAKSWFQVTEVADATLAQFERELDDTAPWLAEVTGPNEIRARTALLQMWQNDPRLAEEMAALSWVANGMSALEPAVLEQMAILATISTAAAQTVISWPWVEDGLGDTEWQDLRNLAALGQNDREGLPAVTQYSWLADDLTDDESASLEYLVALSVSDSGPAPASA